MKQRPPQHEPSNLIAGQWTPLPGAGVVSTNPARPADVVWSGTPRAADVDAAVAAARAAFPAWARLPVDRREAALKRFADLARGREPALAALICDEVGKVLWEARQEASLLAMKADITLDRGPGSGRGRVTPFDVAVGATRHGRCLFRPHGVMAVIGPFNFPMHLACGHILPALLMGNTIVFKPSDKAPACGQALAELLDDALRAELGDAGAAGVVNLVHGAGDIAGSLGAHAGVDGIAFTGSWPVGRRILEANLDRPGRIIALEMGGNSAAIVLPDADLRQAAIEIVRCAFNTAGQRCTCTRRAIIHRSVADRLVPAIAKAATNLIVGDPRATHPVFMGPVISAAARDAVTAFQTSAGRDGSEVLVPACPLEVAGCEGGHFLTAGLIRTPRFEPGPGDTEIFGPLLRVSLCESLDDAIDQANATQFGLAASIFTRDQAAVERFLLECRAGCLNINTGTAGASSRLPFGGLGRSGNHRPAGAFALDYCAVPIAAIRETGAAATIAEGMRFEDAWLR